MIEPRLNPLFIKGFAMASKALLRSKSEATYLIGKEVCDSFLSLDEIKAISGPVIFYSTHSAWLDPIVAADICLNKLNLKAIATMDQKQLEQYKSLKNVGLFGVQRGDANAASEVVKSFWQKNKNGAVWVTPQGKFAPNECEQPEFRPGVSQWSCLEGLKPQRIAVFVHYIPSCWSSKLRIFLSFAKAKEFIGDVDGDMSLLKTHLDELTKKSLNYVWSSFNEKGPHLRGASLL